MTNRSPRSFLIGLNFEARKQSSEKGGAYGGKENQGPAWKCDHRTIGGTDGRCQPAPAVRGAGAAGSFGLTARVTVGLFVGPASGRLLPLSALLGASFLVLADLGARTVVRPGELPVGVITAMIGAPFFLFLLRRQTKAFF